MTTDDESMDVLERLRNHQRERTVAKQRVAEIEAVVADGRRRGLRVYDHEHLVAEKQALVVRLAELRKLVREDELALGKLERERSRNAIPGTTLTGALRSLIDHAGLIERVFVIACDFVDSPTEKNRKRLETAVRKGRAS